MPVRPSKKVRPLRSDNNASPEGNKKRAVEGARGYAEYSGLAIQMIVILLLGVYAGKWLDGHFATETPWFTIVGSLLAIVLALYIPLRRLLR